MANYFVLNTKFQPYTFDEMIKPYQIYGKAYKEQENALDALQTDAEAVKSLMGNSSAYRDWIKTAEAISDELAKNGLNATTKRQIRNLTKAYTPIKAGTAAYKDMLEYREKLIGTHPKERIIFTNEYTPDELIGGVLPDNSFINVSQITDDLLQQSKLYAEGLNGILGTDGNISPSISYSVSPDNKFVNITEGSGVSDRVYNDAVQEIMNNRVSEDSTNPLVRMYKSIWDANNGDKLSPEKQAVLREGIINGLNGSRVSTKTTTHNNPSYESPAAIKAREQAMGERPIGKDKDGNLIYSNFLGEYWKTSPDKKTIIGSGNVEDKTDEDDTQEELDKKGKKFSLDDLQSRETRRKEVPLIMFLRGDDTNNSIGETTDEDKIDWENLVKLDSKSNINDYPIYDTGYDETDPTNTFSKQLQSFITGKGIDKDDVDVYIDRRGWWQKDRFVVVGKGMSPGLIRAKEHAKTTNKITDTYTNEGRENLKKDRMKVVASTTNEF